MYAWSLQSAVSTSRIGQNSIKLPEYGLGSTPCTTILCQQTVARSNTHAAAAVVLDLMVMVPGDSAQPSLPITVAISLTVYVRFR